MNNECSKLVLEPVFRIKSLISVFANYFYSNFKCKFQLVSNTWCNAVWFGMPDCSSSKWEIVLKLYIPMFVKKNILLCNDLLTISGELPSTLVWLAKP